MESEVVIQQEEVIAWLQMSDEYLEHVPGVWIQLKEEPD